MYESRGGYQAARKALATDPDSVVTIVKDSELRGRGGAGFPCGLKWTFLPKDRKETLMCINADESEPATFNNRLLMEKDPAPVHRGDLDRLLRDQGDDGLSLPAVRIHPGLSHPRGGDRRSPRGRAPGQEHLRHRASTSTSGCTAGPGPTSAARRPG